MSPAARIGLVLGLMVVSSGIAAQPQSTWIHMSDTHAPLPGSAETIAAVKEIKAGVLEPFGVEVPAPELIVVTGDLTEFGGSAAGRKAFDTWRGWFTDLGIPVHGVMGNHDATWDHLGPALRSIGQEPNRVFRHGGCAFVILDSSTPQDPRPSFAAEDVAWLRRALAGIAPEVPIFLFSHHPPDGQEFAGTWERNRILDLLDGRPVAAWFVGHYHSAFHSRVEGIDIVGGGSTLPKNPRHRGFSVVSVKDGVLRVVFRRFGAEPAWIPLLEKPLAGTTRASLLVSEPEPGARLAPGGIGIRATFHGDAAGLTAEAVIEGTAVAGPLACRTVDGGSVEITGTLDVASLAAGDHVLTVRARGAQDASWARGVPIAVERDGAPEISWRAPLDTSVRALAAGDGLVLVAGGDGSLRALDPASGSQRWKVATGGEILGRPLVHAGHALFASGDGLARSVDAKGRVRWTVALGAAAFAAPTLAGPAAVFATNAGSLVALDPADGRKLGECPAAGYAIESPLVFDGERLLFGAWDEHLHAFALESAGLRRLWKCRVHGPKAARAAAAYFSPGDAAPVSTGGLVYVADRAFELSVVDAKEGTLLGHVPGVAALAAGPRPGTVVARGKEDAILLVERDKILARIEAPTGPVPVPPVDLGGGRWLVCGDRGDVTVWAPGSEAPPLRYRLFTGGFHLATPLLAGPIVVFGSMDGTVTAVRMPAPGKSGG